MINNLPIGHLKICSGDMGEMLEFIDGRISENRRIYCIPLNLIKYVVSQKDIKLKESINAADLVISDGISIVWMSRRLGYRDVRRVTGIDLAEALISSAGKKGWKFFFLGASSDNLHRAIDNLRKKLGNINLVGYHHGFFKTEESQDLVDYINGTKADILFLGLGMPQKEYFIHDYFDKMAVKFCLPVGGAFDIWAEAKKRAPQMIQKIGLEWLYRSLYDSTKVLNIARYGLIFFKDFLFNKNEAYPRCWR